VIELLYRVGRSRIVLDGKVTNADDQEFGHVRGYGIFILASVANNTRGTRIARGGFWGAQSIRKSQRTSGRYVAATRSRRV